MKVSILVPIYGVERAIETCAESLFSQTYEQLEYIFVDDCSPDRSTEILQEVLSRHPHRQDQVTILRHDRNRGLGAARLTALMAATGEFVIHVDSDDWLTTDAVERLVNRQQETGADVVDGGFVERYADGTTRTVLPWHGSKEAYLKLLLAQNTLPHQIWARLIRRSIHLNHQILPTEGINQAEDYYILPRIIWFANRSWIDDIVSNYRIYEYGMFKDGISPRHVGSLLKANQAVANFIHEHDTEKRYAWATKVGLLKIYGQAVRAGVKANELGSRLPAFRDSKLLGMARFILRLPFGDRLVRYQYLALKGLLREKTIRSPH